LSEEGFDLVVAQETELHMGELSRRNVLAAAAGTAGALGLAACGSGSEPHSSDAGGRPSRTPKASPSARPRKKVRLIGDGSTSDSGAQPGQPKPERLKPGQAPPQFVVFSWDGAGVTGNNLFARFRELATRHKASMTFFLSGIYLLPESKKRLYHPPRKPVGASDIGYLTDDHIHDTLVELRKAWNEGHEIGTHFNGHFCGPSGGRQWSPADWRSEIDQAKKFVKEWKTNTGFTDLPALPFDYEKELIGGRTPCLEGQDNLLPTARALGWKYDASSPGGRQMWPDRKGGVWDLPLQSMPFPGHSFEVLSMDYNILANQSGGSTKGNRGSYAGWRRQARDSYLRGFERAYGSNRAPLFIGNHFEEWNGGIYMDAVEEVIGTIAGKPDVRMVSFRQMVEWLEAQDPKVLEKLRTLEVGMKPAGGWDGFLAAPAATPRTPASGAPDPTSSSKAGSKSGR
jgi:hypothetical protein